MTDGPYWEEGHILHCLRLALQFAVRSSCEALDDDASKAVAWDTNCELKRLLNGGVPRKYQDKEE